MPAAGSGPAGSGEVGTRASVTDRRPAAVREESGSGSAAEAVTRDHAGPGPRRRRSAPRVLGALAGLLAAAVALGAAELVAGVVGPASSPGRRGRERRHRADPGAGEGRRDRDLRRSTTRSRWSPARSSCSSRSTRSLVGLRRPAQPPPRRRRRSLCSVWSARSPPSPGPAAGRSTCCRRSVGAAAGVPGAAGAARAADLPPAAPPARAGHRSRRPAARGARLRRPQGRLDRRRFFVAGGVAARRRRARRGRRPAAAAPLRRRRRAGRPRAADAGVAGRRAARRRGPVAGRCRGLTPLFTREPATSTGSTPRSPCRRSGPADYRLTPRRHVRLAAQLHAGRPVRPRRPHRARHHAHLRLQRGRRHAGRHRAVARASRSARSCARTASGRTSTQLVCRSVDGMTIGAPTRSALDVDGRDAGHRDERRAAAGRARLPGADGHPRPLRLRVGLQVADPHRGDDLRRVRRLLGRSGAGPPQGPIKVASRIDTPRRSAPFPAGRRADRRRGLGADPRHRAASRCGSTTARGPTPSSRPAVDADLWRQWVLPDDFAAGRHTLTVRATTADGEVQTAGAGRSLPLRRHRLAQRSR